MIDVLCCKCVGVAKSVLMLKRHECKEEVCVKTQETQKIHFASVSEFSQLFFSLFFFFFFVLAGLVLQKLDWIILKYFTVQALRLRNLLLDIKIFLSVS